MNILLVIQAFVTLSLIGVILLQKSEGGALGMGGNAGAFTARGTANFLSRLTAILAAIFMANCLLMSVLAGRQVREESVLSQGASTTQQSESGEAEAPAE